MVNKYKKIILVLITFIALSILCYFFPYVHDDWAWGSSIGLDRLNSGFADYGGRYFGYLIVILMTRFKVLAALIMGGVLTGIAICVKRLVNSWWAFGATLILMFLLPQGVFAQSISWISGFANYATTALVVLIFLNILKDIIIDNKKEKLIIICLMPVMGLGGSLILENVTIYLVIMSVMAQLYLFIKERRFSWSLFLFMLGAGAGAIWMFSNSAYHNVMLGEDAYRSVTTSTAGLLSRVKDNYLNEIYLYGLFKNVIINLVLIIGGAAVLAFGKIKKKSALISFGFFIAYTVYVIVSEVIIGWVDKPEIVLYFEGLLSVIALMALMVFSISISEKKTSTKKILIISWLSFLILLAPLLFITPIGPRNFLATDAIMILTCCLWWGEALRYIYEKDERIYQQFINVGKKIGIIVMVSLWVIFMGIFINVTQEDAVRLQNIKNEIDAGEKTTIIKTLPFESLMWESTPKTETFMKRYKLFYDLPEDINLVVEER